MPCERYGLGRGIYKKKRRKNIQFGVNPGYFKKSLSIERAAKILAESGIPTVDYNSSFAADDWESVANSDLAILEKAGITVHQTHAP